MENAKRKYLISVSQVATQDDRNAEDHNTVACFCADRDLYLDARYLSNFLGGGLESIMEDFNTALTALGGLARHCDIDQDGYADLLDAMSLLNNCYVSIYDAMPRKQQQVRRHSDFKAIWKLPIYTGEVFA